MSRPSSVREMWLRKREAGEENAEEWADNFSGQCREFCKHTAAEHSEARLHLACVFKDLLAEVRAARAAGFDERRADVAIDWPTTLALRDAWFTEEDGTTWRIVQVARDGRVLGYRDAPYYDYPGCAVHRWFDGSVLQERIDSIWWGQ